MSHFQELFLLLNANDFRMTYETITHEKEFLKTAYKRLTRIYKQNQHAKAVLDRFANLDEHLHLVHVTELEDKIKIGPADKPRGPIVQFLKQLAQWKWGAFTIGRRGHDSRFSSTYSLKKIGSLAGYYPHADILPYHEEDTDFDTGDAQIANGESESHEQSLIVPPSPQNLRHRFLLRPDFPIELGLPVNLTNAEASRFADFIKSLPFN